MSRRISIEALADTVMEYLNDYADVSAEGMKKAVRKAGNTVKKEIGANAPKDTGAYAKSWAVKNTKETANALEVTVYSRNKYQLAHLLEHGHAKRNGGRVAGKSHIAPAEETGIRQLEAEIERSLRNG
ncbi:MAG: HK97 gp10 family phage protein [Bacteroidales bacterium]|nr:HK97 gp10 family phage protein [Bacteroidales bacterium]